MEKIKYILVFTSLLILSTLIYAQLPTTGFSPIPVKFSNPYFTGETGWKIENSNLYKSIDNGNTWNQVTDISFPINNLGCIGFTDEQTGYIIHDKWVAATFIYYAIGLTFGVIGVILLSKYQEMVEEAEAEESESEVQTG